MHIMALQREPDHVHQPREHDPDYIPYAQAVEERFALAVCFDAAVAQQQQFGGPQRCSNPPRPLWPRLQVRLTRFARSVRRWLTPDLVGMLVVRMPNGSVVCTSWRAYLCPLSC